MVVSHNKKSIDYHIYQNFVDPIAKNLCFISPNFITLLNILMIIPIIDNLINKKSFKMFLVLIIFRNYLDFLDGSVARKCNKTSKFGAVFDTISDLLYFLILTSVLIYNMRQNKNNIPLIVLLICFTICLIIMAYIYLLKIYKNKSKPPSKIHNFFIENSVIVTIPYVIFCKLKYV